MAAMDILYMLVILISAGAVAGILAGLLGVGGGVVLVPAFLIILHSVGYSGEFAMQIAVATSLTTIIATSMRSVQAHWKRGAVDVSLLKRLIAPVAIGALSGMALAQVMESAHMMAVFGVLGTCVGIYMVLSPSVAREGAALPRPPVTFASATLFGGLSALMGIGGGSFFVPFLSYFGKSTHQAVATSSGIGMLIAIPSAIGFMIVPTPAGAPPLMLGQVNLGAVFIIACTTFVFAPLGAALAHKLDSKKLKRVFGVFLIFTALRMLSKAIEALS